MIFAAAECAVDKFIFRGISFGEWAAATSAAATARCCQQCLQLRHRTALALPQAAAAGSELRSIAGKMQLRRWWKCRKVAQAKPLTITVIAANANLARHGVLAKDYQWKCARQPRGSHAASRKGFGV
eukprot:CAMPEP_0115631606 /NCGR_PEP_ID=MMETSP0272-20121206/31083_1 /TAXON_ID=71861 /ORGANISM="Scrippsiella trochoidea, Strain CCMP3099" /LENGTH=126 /DNA_ID=CAMNT_0003068271 /DNA_START=64 /DNA_END=445 /DNA_ORIENTATION=+